MNISIESLSEEKCTLRDESKGRVLAIRRYIKRVSGYNVVAHSWNYTVVISPDCYGRDLYLPVACSLLNIKKLHKTVC